VPAPTTRNLKANPSFEQGLRYWTWWYGGAKLRADGQPGLFHFQQRPVWRQVLLVRREAAAQAIMSFPIPVEKARTTRQLLRQREQAQIALFASACKAR